MWQQNINVEPKWPLLWARSIVILAPAIISAAIRQHSIDKLEIYELDSKDKSALL